MNKWKRFLFLAALVVFAAVFLSVGAWAADVIDSGTCGAEGDGSNVSWTLDSDGVLTISGTGAMRDYAEGSEESWLQHSSQIKSVVISNGVTNLGKYAFSGCEQLNSVAIGSSVTSIGDSAFRNCVNMTSVTLPLPNSVTSIGERAFLNCYCLSAFRIPDGVTRIEPDTFWRCSSLSEITIPNGVTGIGNWAFAGCLGLKRITIPASVTYFRKPFGELYHEYPQDMLVRGYDRSAAQSIARDYGFEWESMGMVDVTTVYITPADGTRSNADVEQELRAALQDNTRIILADGVYTIQRTLQISGINLTIEAEHPGHAEILSNDLESSVVFVLFKEHEGWGSYAYMQSCFVDLKGLILGHAGDVRMRSWGCGDEAYVYYGLYGTDCSIVNCDLWGCGLVAIYSGGRRLVVTDSILRDCTRQAVADCNSAVFERCIISGNGVKEGEQYPCITYKDYNDGNVSEATIVFKECQFFNNYNTLLTDDISASQFVDCTFHDNVWQGKTPKHYGICIGDGVLWEATEMADGAFELWFGREIDFGDGTVLSSGEGVVPNYSAYSIPWKGLELNSLNVSPGVSLVCHGVQNVKVNVDYSNAGISPGTYEMAYALYNENGRMRSVEIQTVNFSDGNFKTDFSIEIAEGVFCKAFLLNEDYCPQCGDLRIDFV